MKLTSAMSFGLLVLSATIGRGAILTGTIVDANSGKPIPARIYIKSADGKWHHVQSSDQGTAVPYEKVRGESSEVHTTVSAHPFVVDLTAGAYTIRVERGKEYLPVETPIELEDESLEIELRLTRWTNMARRGWYSGETHVHRELSVLPNLMLAEDLNVAFPLTYWVRESSDVPADSNEASLAPRLIEVDSQHVIWPINTEYEIFTVNGQRHTLGAVFVLNHRTPLTDVAPPVSTVERKARAENAMLDLDKHNWPWSMLIVPLMHVDLFELSNNHIWRTKFLFRNWYPEYIPKYMQIETDDNGGYTERGWIDFGFQNYYALLNCGFRMMPTAGTASGVHPVPLGFGRVYVNLPNGFRYDDWVKGLRQGRSFVTTGPMLTVSFNGEGHGATLRGSDPLSVRIQGTIESTTTPDSIEIIVNGELRQSVDAQLAQTEGGVVRASFAANVKLDRTSWIVVRCFEQDDEGRVRFAHTSPVYATIPGKPLRPRHEEVEYLLKRATDELNRSRPVLDPTSIAEYAKAVDVYRKLLASAQR